MTEATAVRDRPDFLTVVMHFTGPITGDGNVRRCNCPFCDGQNALRIYPKEKEFDCTDCAREGGVQAFLQYVEKCGVEPHHAHSSGQTEGQDNGKTHLESLTADTAEADKQPAPASGMPDKFRIVTDDESFGARLEYRQVDDNGAPDWQLVCRPAVHIIAKTHDEHSESWGARLHWQDREGQDHDWAMPMSMLAGSGEDIRARLLDGGVTFAPGTHTNARFKTYLQSTRPDRTEHCVSHIGWHWDADRRRAFVLTDQVIGGSQDTLMCYQSPGGTDHSLSASGSLEDWQSNVASLCVGNRHMTFAVCYALSAPLLKLLGAESGAFHLWGRSSTGKTTCLDLAASVCGRAIERDDNSYIKTWLTTIVGLEMTAALRCDVLLALDELGNVNGKDLGRILYMLSAGMGKQRGTKYVTARKSYHWDTQVYSTGELTIAQKLRQDGGGDHTAGQQVRCIELEGPLSQELGVFEKLHGFGSGREFSQHIKRQVALYHGTALRAFLRELVADEDACVSMAQQCIDAFHTSFCPQDADSQVERVCQRFALVAAAGEIATRFGVVPWGLGTATEGAGQCFNAWLDQRGSIEPAEVTTLVQHVQGFFEKNAESRFTDISRVGSEEHRFATRDRAGFRKKVGDQWEYWVLPQVFKNELVKGVPLTEAKRILVERGMLKRHLRTGRYQFSEHIPGEGSQWIFRFVRTSPEDSGEKGDTGEK